MPDRSCNHFSFQFNVYWKLRMGCFVTDSSLMKHVAFHLKKGWVETHFPRDPNSESFIWPTELHILFHYGAMNILALFGVPLWIWGKTFLKKLENSLNYPCQNKPPVQEIPPDLRVPERNLEGFNDHFVKRVVKRWGVFLLMKFRFAPILKPLNAAFKALKWMFWTISLLVLVLAQTFCFYLLRWGVFSTS